MVDASLQLVDVGNRVDNASRHMRVGLSGAVHSLNALWDDDNERCPYEHAGAEEGDDAQLARREGKGEREDAGNERTDTISYYSMRYHYLRARDAYAIAIIVLNVSNMKRPSHMLRVVCGCPLKSLKKEEYAGYARKEDKDVRHSALPMPQYQSSEMLWSRVSVCMLIQHGPPQMSLFVQGLRH